MLAGAIRALTAGPCSFPAAHGQDLTEQQTRYRHLATIKDQDKNKTPRNQHKTTTLSKPQMSKHYPTRAPFFLPSRWQLGYSVTELLPPTS